MDLIRVKDRLNEPALIALLMLSMFRPTPERAAAKDATYMRDNTEILSIATDAAFRSLNVGRFPLKQTAVYCHLNFLEAETDAAAVGFYRRCGNRVERCGDIDGRARYRCRKTLGPT